MVNDHNEPITRIIHFLINEGTLTFIYYNVYESIIRIIHLLINKDTLTFIYYNVYEGYTKHLSSFVESSRESHSPYLFCLSIRHSLSLSSHFLVLAFHSLFLYTKRKINPLLVKV